MPTGIYLSVPFCRSKCSFCNFASGVFAREKMAGYVTRLEQEIAGSFALAERMGTELDPRVDSIYLGGGTPTTLAPEQLANVFASLRNSFDVQEGSEITVECAPGTLSPEMLQELVSSGVNRVSLGVQSFVDQETRSVGRLHTAKQALDDIARLRSLGIENISVDLIAGLPYQTRESWGESLRALLGSGVPHASVYILEVDEDSRLGKELMAGGVRYHAHHVPDSDLAADLYSRAIEVLRAAGVCQYEISNFSRPGFESRHNKKYWHREPYIGFGLDAHSMLRSRSRTVESVRFSNADDLVAYLAGAHEPAVEEISFQQAEEEELFLGLRLNEGISASRLPPITGRFETEIRELLDCGLLERDGSHLRLTDRGRLLSNEVFERFVGQPTAA